MWSVHLLNRFFSSESEVFEKAKDTQVWLKVWLYVLARQSRHSGSLLRGWGVCIYIIFDTVCIPHGDELCVWIITSIMYYLEPYWGRFLWPWPGTSDYLSADLDKDGKAKCFCWIFVVCIFNMVNSQYIYILDIRVIHSMHKLLWIVPLISWMYSIVPTYLIRMDVTACVGMPSSWTVGRMFMMCFILRHKIWGRLGLDTAHV